MADTGAEATGRAVRWIVAGITITGPVRRRRWTTDEKARIRMEGIASVVMQTTL
jgi:hypothetical protein